MPPGAGPPQVRGPIPRNRPNWPKAGPAQKCCETHTFLRWLRRNMNVNIKFKNFVWQSFVTVSQQLLLFNSQSQYGQLFPGLTLLSINQAEGIKSRCEDFGLWNLLLRIQLHLLSHATLPKLKNYYPCLGIHAYGTSWEVLIPPCLKKQVFQSVLHQFILSLIRSILIKVQGTSKH